MGRWPFYVYKYERLYKEIMRTEKVKMNKKINIALIFMLIGVFMCSDISYGLRVPINTSQVLRNGLRPEFVYYTRDENGNLLKEPCGFPGNWVVEVKIPIKEDTNAGLQRMVKSFSLSMQVSGRIDVRKAKFTIVNKLPEEQKGVLVRENDFYIKSSREFGIEIVIAGPFLKNEISAQRAIFSRIADRIPRQADLVMLGTAKIQKPAGNKIKKAAVINMIPTIDMLVRNYSELSSTSLTLASLLKEAGYDASIVNIRMTDDSILEVKKELEEVDIVCISIYDIQIPYIKLFTEYLKKINPNIIIAVGGPMVTIIPEHAFAHLPNVDIFYRGEAEAGFIDLLKGLEDLKPETLSGTSGTAVRAGNTYYFNNFISINRMTIEQLNNRPFDFSLLNQDSLNGHLSLMTSLGCPYSCVFCATGGGKRYRAMRPEKVIEICRGYQKQLEKLEAEGAVIHPDAWTVVLSDDDFLRDPERAVRILELWRQERLRLKITSFQSTMQSLLTKKAGEESRANIYLIDRIASFKDIFAFEFKIQIGTDALIDPEIKRLNKGPYNEKAIEEVIAALDRRGIINQHSLILTNADTSLEDLIRTLIKASVFDIRYPYSIFYTNYAIIAHTGTTTVNNLIEGSREPLIRARWNLGHEGISGFKEYDFYRYPDIINPDRIPVNIFSELGNFFEAQSFFNQYPKYRTLEGLASLVTAINEDVDSLLSASSARLGPTENRKWDFYKDIPKRVFTSDVNELAALLVNKANLPSGIDEFTFLRACMGLNLIGHKLEALKARYRNLSVFNTLAVHEIAGSSL